MSGISAASRVDRSCASCSASATARSSRSTPMLARDAVRRYLNEVTAHGPEAQWQVRRNRAAGRINRIEFGSAGSPTAGWSATCTRPPTMKVNF